MSGSKPKILRIANRFNLGGPTYNVAYLTKYLEPDFETLLVGGEKDETEESSTFILDNLGIKPLIIPEMKREIDLKNDRIAYQKIKQIIREFKPDIVHTHASKAGAIGRLAASSMNVPLIFHTFHGHVFHSYFGSLKTQFYKNIERYLAKKSTKIIALSPTQKNELVNIHRIAPEKKIEIISLGFDLLRFTLNKEENRKNFREKYQVKEDEIAIGIIGRLVPIKNHRLFLKAIQYLTQNTSKKIKAFVIGDGESKNDILKTTQDLGLSYSTEPSSEARVIFTSWIQNVDWAYAGLDIVCLTSFNEGTPVSLIEAQAAGKPVITTNVGGVEDIIQKDKTGFITDPLAEHDFFHGLQKLVEDENLRAKFSEKGAEWALEKFSYHRLVNNMSTLYKNEGAKIRLF